MRLNNNKSCQNFQKILDNFFYLVYYFPSKNGAIFRLAPENTQICDNS